jgi:apolipoprotein N-acyltransferase
MERAVRTALAAGSGALLALAFPAPALDVCAWVALVPLLHATAGGGVRRALGLGWLTGFVFALGTLYWTVNPIDHYTDAPFALAVGVLVLLAAAVGCYLAAFSGGVCLARRASVPLVLSAPLLWVSVEWLRSVGPLAFPWVALGYSQYQRLDLIQVAEVTGMYGLSALIVAGNAAIHGVLTRGSASLATRAIPLLLVAALVAGLTVVGAERRAAVLATPPTGEATVGVVQANVDQGGKWDPAFRMAAIERHAALTAEAKAKGAELVIWPETAVPFYFQTDGEERRYLVDRAAAMDVDLVFGAPGFADGDGRLRLFNRAYLLRRDGTVGGVYDKLRLVPFGEYVPFQTVFFFVDKIVEGVGDFRPGTAATVFTVPSGRFGVLICYEGIFPDLSRQLAARGANFLVNITNDAWFGDTAAPHQHLSMVTFRAIENRVPIVRVANTGISAIIDVDGHIRWQTPLFAAATRTDTVAWAPRETFYTRHGDLLVWVSGLASLALMGYGVVRGGGTESQERGG